MGTSTRRTIPRLKDILNNSKFDDANNISVNDFKLVLQKLLFPHGRRSIQHSNIMSSVTSTNFIKSIKKIIDFSKKYKSSGVFGFGIPNFHDYTFDEQIDLIADEIVESENPELKQSIKDILYANGIDKVFSETEQLVIEVFKKYIERKIQGYLVEEFAIRNEKFADENFYNLLDVAISLTISKILTHQNVNTLVLKCDEDIFITKWVDSNVELILEGVVV